jgi:hypothetical protein
VTSSERMAAFHQRLGREGCASGLNGDALAGLQTAGALLHDLSGMGEWGGRMGMVSLTASSSDVLVFSFWGFLGLVSDWYGSCD